MARIPSQKTPFNISDIVAKRQFDASGKETFRAYGTDYSELGGHVLYIGSAPLERFLAFKAFFETIKLNLNKSTDIETMNTRNYQILKEKSGKFSISLSLILPAHSTNEAQNNIAKIEELQKLILPGKWAAGGKSLSYGRGDRSFTFEGVSKKVRTTLPLFQVYFKNIINSGAGNQPKTIEDYSDLMKHGFPCYIDSVNYTPDETAGFYEFDDFLFPKVIKLNLILNYDTESLFDETIPALARKPIMPFRLNGHYAQYDSSLFPFGVKVSRSGKSAFGTIEGPKELSSPKNVEFSLDEMNNLAPQGVGSLSSYVFISMPIDPPPLESSFADSSGGFDDPENCVFRCVVFKPFIEQFSRNVKTKVKLAPDPNSTIHGRVLQHGVTPDPTEYSFKLTIPSESLEEAKKNCGKIQYLMRMFYKRYYNGKFKIKKPMSRDDLFFEDVKSKLMVYIPTMIEMPGSGNSKAIALGDMFRRAVPLFINSMSIDFDFEAGFFEQDNRIFPKVMSINFKFIYNRADMIRNYNKGEGEEEYYYHSPQKKPLIPASQSHLFPFNRETSKIGAPRSSKYSVTKEKGPLPANASTPGRPNDIDY